MPDASYDPRKLKGDEGAASDVQKKMEDLVKKLESISKKGAPQDEKIKKEFEKVVKDIRAKAEKLDKDSTGFEKESASEQKRKPKDQQKGIDKLMKSVGGINKAGSKLGQTAKTVEAALKKGKSSGKPDAKVDKKSLDELKQLQQMMSNVMKHYDKTAQSVIRNIR